MEYYYVRNQITNSDIYIMMSNYVKSEKIYNFVMEFKKWDEGSCVLIIPLGKKCIFDMSFKKKVNEFDFVEMI